MALRLGLVRNEIGPFPAFPLHSRPGTKPYPLSPGSIPSDASASARESGGWRRRGSAGSERASSARQLAASARGGWRRGASAAGRRTHTRRTTTATSGGSTARRSSPTPASQALVGKGSPKLNTMARVSPKFQKFLAPTSVTRKKLSPKAKQRAYWSPSLEKSLVEILHEYKDSGYRGDNGWKSEGWNHMVKEFHRRNKYVSFTKAQIQEKEGQLKRDYKMLKEARRHSGSSWNNERNMIEGSAAMWDNLIITFPKIKKFRNSRASFPLFDALGELYDGHLAKGNHNFTSLDTPQEEEPLQQIEDTDVEVEEFNNVVVHEVPVEDEAQDLEQNQDVESEYVAVESSGQRKTTATSRKNEEKEAKRPKKLSNVESMMERYQEMRTKQAEDEAAHLAREKDGQSSDFSIKRCILVLNTLEVTKEEKAKAYTIFKNAENREIFLSACLEDQESAMLWLRSEMT